MCRPQEAVRGVLRDPERAGLFDVRTDRNKKSLLLALLQCLEMNVFHVCAQLEKEGRRMFTWGWQYRGGSGRHRGDSDLAQRMPARA